MAYTAVTYPAWAYNATQPARVVANATEFAALPAPGAWSFNPADFVVPPSSTAPSDPGLTYTDTRLTQILVESRIANRLLHQGLTLPAQDDPVTVLRPDVLATDASITS